MTSSTITASHKCNDYTSSTLITFEKNSVISVGVNMTCTSRAVAQMYYDNYVKVVNTYVNVTELLKDKVYTDLVFY